MDTQLRYLERAAAASGAASDQAAVLTERVRGGLLTTDRLKLAAYCGDPAARLATGLPFVMDNPRRRSRTKGFRVESWSAIDDDTLDRWAHGLTFWDGKTTVRGLTIGARAALPVWARRFGVRKREGGVEETIVDGPCGDAGCCPHAKGPPACNHIQRGGPRRSTEAVERWLACVRAPGCDDCRNRLESTPDLVLSDEGGRTNDAWWTGSTTLALWITDETLPVASKNWLIFVGYTSLGIGDILGVENAKTIIGSGLSVWALGGGT